MLNQLTFINIFIYLCHFLLNLIGCFLFILSLYLLLECLATLLPARSQLEKHKDSNSRVAVLIPAHNEASEIGATLTNLIPQLTHNDRLIVIADNCTDNTAWIAQEFGVTVIERTNAQERGKGYALDYGLRFLEADPPDIVIIIDADCSTEPNSLRSLVHAVEMTNRPVQAAYLMESPPNPSPKDLISALAFLVKNIVRSTGLMKLGLPSLLNGTGMAFPWQAIKTISLASGNIVEDIQLCIDLALAGYPSSFCDQARIIGRLPQENSVATGQRTRWEHGHLQTILTQVPRLIQGAIQQKRWKLLTLALELAIPPLSLLVIFWGMGMSGSIALQLAGKGAFSTLFFVLIGSMIFTAIFIAWLKFGRQLISGLTLLKIPFYLMWKIPIYLAFLIKPEKNWIRTERDSKIL